MKRAGKIIHRVLLIIWGIILAVIIYLLAAQRISGEQAPEIFGFRIAAAVSGSMEPVFSAGDLLVYQKRSVYQDGDIVLFRQDGSLITHRIINIQGNEYQTKGDANSAADGETITCEAILGEVVLVLPHVGSVILFLKSPLGILILLGSAVMLMWSPHVRKGGSNGR